jgi:hypothetical protein
MARCDLTSGCFKADRSLVAKIQYPPDMRLSGDQVSIEVPQREGDGRQALASSPFMSAPAASLIAANLPATIM